MYTLFLCENVAHHMDFHEEDDVASIRQTPLRQECVMAATTFFAPAETVNQLERLVNKSAHDIAAAAPDLVFDSVTDTTSVLQSFSNILLIGRALLVPIIVTLPDLPLILAHLLHAHTTLSFAFSVADEPDIPAIMRTLLRSSENASSSVAKFHLPFIGSLPQSSGCGLHVFPTYRTGKLEPGNISVYTREMIGWGRCVVELAIYKSPKNRKRVCVGQKSGIGEGIDDCEGLNATPGGQP